MWFNHNLLIIIDRFEQRSEISNDYCCRKLRGPSQCTKKRRQSLDYGSGSECEEMDTSPKPDQSHVIFGCITGNSPNKANKRNWKWAEPRHVYSNVVTN